MTGDLADAVQKKTICLFHYQMTATLAWKSNEAFLNLGSMMRISQFMSVCNVVRESAGPRGKDHL